MKNKIKFKSTLVITDSFYPETVSAAVHMAELVDFVSKFNKVTLVSSCPNKVDVNKLLINRCTLNNPFKRSSNKILRAVFELIIPFFLAIKFNLKYKKKFDNTIIYSPTIFWYFFIFLVGKESLGKIILIQRDIFPLWAAQVGILSKRSLIYQFFNKIFKSLLSFVDKIYAQSSADLDLLINEYKLPLSKLDILHNWYEFSDDIHFVEKNTLNFKVFCLGNFGIAQNRNHVAKVAKAFLSKYTSCQFIFMGLKSSDTAFFEDKLCLFLPKKRVSFLSARSHSDAVKFASNANIGLVSLSANLNIGNIPGKFVAYVMAGLPSFILAPKTFIVSKIVENNELGEVASSASESLCADELYKALEKFHNQRSFFEKIRTYGKDNFSTSNILKIMEYTNEKFTR